MKNNVKKYVNLTNFSRFTTNCSSFDFTYGAATKNHISKDNSLIINEMLYASELYHLKIFVQIPINILKKLSESHKFDFRIRILPKKFVFFKHLFPAPSFQRFYAPMSCAFLIFNIQSIANRQIGMREILKLFYLSACLFLFLSRFSFNILFRNNNSILKNKAKTTK